MHLSIRWVSKKSIIIFKYVLGETKKKKTSVSILCIEKKSFKHGKRTGPSI